MIRYDSSITYNADGQRYDARSIIYETSLAYNHVGLGYNTLTVIYDSDFTYNSPYIVYGGARFDTPEPGTTFATELNRLANLGNYPAIADYLTPTHAANVWAGTVGLPLVAALNYVHDRNKSLSGFLPLRAVLNAIAGTTNLSETDALRSIL